MAAIKLYVYVKRNRNKIVNARLACLACLLFNVYILIRLAMTQLSTCVCILTPFCLNLVAPSNKIKSSWTQYVDGHQIIKRENTHVQCTSYTEHFIIFASDHRQTRNGQASPDRLEPTVDTVAKNEHHCDMRASVSMCFYSISSSIFSLFKASHNQ